MAKPKAKTSKVTRTTVKTTKTTTSRVQKSPTSLSQQFDSSAVEKGAVMKILIALPLIAAALSLLLRVDFMTSIGLFLALPAILLSLVLPFSIKKSAIFSFMVLPVGFVIDYLAQILGQWSIPTSIFPRIAGVVPAENLLWIFLSTYTVIMFYEYFLDRQNGRELYNKNFVYMYAIFTFAPIIYFLLGLMFPVLFSISYLYLVVGVFTVLLPITYFLIRFPGLRSKFFATGIFFFYLFAIYEFTALINAWWVFPDSAQYLGTLKMLGISLPVEVFFFSIVLYSVAVLSWYEFFDDDRI
jgi:hypothetical protein